MSLEVKNLAVFSGNRKILNDVSFEIKRGEWMGVAGETGSGKTTLLRSILRLLPGKMSFRGGEILYKGNNLLKFPEKEMEKIRGKEIFLINQEPHLYFNPSVRIYKQLEEFASIHGLKKDLKEKICSSLELAGLENPEKWIGMFSFQLSSGMLQRIGIGMALLHEPEFILADEPTSSLDRVNEKIILHLFLSLRSVKKIGFIFVTHKINLLKEVTDKIAIIYKGNILEIGKSEDVFSNPLHPYTLLLLGKRPIRNSLFSINSVTEACPFFNRCNLKNSQCMEDPPNVEKYNRKIRCWLYA